VVNNGLGASLKRHKDIFARDDDDVRHRVAIFCVCLWLSICTCNRCYSKFLVAF
jgi:hypothetical protein